MDILERGDIFFLYRPRVDEEQVAGLEGVQRLVVVLRPDRGRVYRRILIGRKRFPDPDAAGTQRYWAFVERVGRRAEEVSEDLGREQRQTRTRGTRVQPEARPAGEGRYAIVDHDGHSHLVYELELPDQLGSVQRDLQIRPEASYILTVINPRRPAPPAIGPRLSRRAELPEELIERFGERRFVPATPELLDHEGVELVLIAAGRDVRGAEAEDLDLDAERETRATAELIRELELSPHDRPTEPLTTGEWR
jgi:hypothetical protein